MKLTSKAKLNLTITLVTVYMFAAFFWWTYSLISYGNREKNMQMEILATDSIHAAGEVSHNMIHGRFVKNPTMAFIYDKDTNYTDTAALKSYVLAKFPNYDLHFNPNQQLKKSFQIYIKHAVIKAEETKTKRKRASWISEGVTMGLIMLFISIAMFLYLNRILEINQQQNNFLLAVTHELKTPVASAKLAVQTAVKQTKAEEINLRKLLDMADKNIERLGKMMDHVLMITRLESAVKSNVEQIIIVEDLINHTIEEIKDSIPATTSIKLDLDHDLTITGDPDQLHMAISNLISNAIKYSTKGSEKLTIRSFVDGGNVAVEVADLGQGIPESEKRKIFRKFYRIGDENTRSTAGSGLGLYLVHKILRQHKAIISVSSNIPNGSVFKIVFKNKV